MFFIEAYGIVSVSFIFYSVHVMEINYKLNIQYQ